MAEEGIISLKEFKELSENSISEWARQWKMSFNPDPRKQTEEILYQS